MVKNGFYAAEIDGDRVSAYYIDEDSYYFSKLNKAVADRIERNEEAKSKELKKAYAKLRKQNKRIADMNRRKAENKHHLLSKIPTVIISTLLEITAVVLTYCDLLDFRVTAVATVVFLAVISCVIGSIAGFMKRGKKH